MTEPGMLFVLIFRSNGDAIVHRGNCTCMSRTNEALYRGNRPSPEATVAPGPREAVAYFSARARQWALRTAKCTGTRVVRPRAR